MTAFIEAKNVSFVVEGRRLVDSATLALVPGRLTIVVGTNGAGKSTLLKLLTGQLTASGGEILYGGQPLRGMPQWRLACKRAVMTQSTALAFPFRVHEVARIGLAGIGHILPRAHVDQLVAKSLASAGVLHLADRDFQTLSGGEQQRARFARVLCQLGAGQLAEQQQALLLDEPIASLDIEHQLTLMDTARAIANDGTAVFAILHDLNIAATYADDLAVMASGQIVAYGSPPQVITDEIVADVFSVNLAVGVAPPAGLPFVLPHHHFRGTKPPCEMIAKTQQRLEGSQGCATFQKNENG